MWHTALAPHSIGKQDMSKLKTPTPPTTQAGAADGPQIGFLAALGALAEPFVKPDVPADPVERMRAKFSANAEAAAKDVRAGVEKTKWFRRMPDGKFVVSFRNANSALMLNGSKHFQTADAESAVKLLEAAKTAAAAGEFDEALKATQRKPPVRKKKADA
jgi:uncharacterized protein YegP (UPF0339 family)